MESVLAEIVFLLCLLLIPVFYEVNKAFRYYFKFFLYYGILMITSIIVIPIMVWRPGNVDNLIIASSLCRHISRLLGLKWELKGREYLEKDQAFVIIANHQSSLDILGMFEIWPVMKKCTVVTKKELFYAWPFGLAAWLCGLIFIDRLNSEAARQAINNAVVQLRDDKIKLWVFPEGTRKNTGQIHEFKKGAFRAAISAQLPLLPIVFTQFYFLQNKEKLLDQGHIVMTVLPPIGTEGLTTSDVPRLMEEAHTAMTKTFISTSTSLKEKLNFTSKTE